MGDAQHGPADAERQGGAAPGLPPGPRLNATDFVAAQSANRARTRWLILALLLLGGGFGYLLGLAVEGFTSDPGYFDPLAWSGLGLLGAGIFAAIGVGATAVTFLKGDKVMMSITGAKEVTREEEPVLHNVVEEMAIAAGMPKPRVVVIETDALNAFATGMRPERAALGVTRGLLKSLTREELQGVVGHEMGHIANWDIRYMTAVGILVGLIALVADVIRRGMFRGGFGARGGGGKKGGGAGIVLIALILFSILAPIAAMLLRLAVSRQREYLADATSVRFTRNPSGLIGALGKLGAAAAPFGGANRATQHMFIVNPLRKAEATASALLATHPPIESRIERLQNLGRT
ncbi:MAG: M48 family metallopeptidase [Hyphomicrobium sp.]|uniref:M48 family metallopeptidase n=1 Tax=Hyphomicrobium sp. TaxID=82 RepID=UPI003D0CDAC5